MIYQTIGDLQYTEDTVASRPWHPSCFSLSLSLQE